MKKNFGVKAWLYPMPVLIIGSYGADGTPDAMNAAWGGKTRKISQMKWAEIRDIKAAAKTNANNTTNKTESKLNACYELGKGVK